MNSRSATNLWGVAAALLVSVLLHGNAGAQPGDVRVTAKTTGSVDVLDLRMLLASDDLWFEMFEFEVEDNFCLVVGYTHDINEQRQVRPKYNHAICNHAGRYSLVVAMRPIDDKHRLLVGLHNRDKGSGASRTVADLPIQRDLGGAAFFRAEDSMRPGRETIIVHWRYGRNPPDPGPRHDIRLVVRLDDNDDRIATYPVPNDFAE